MQGGGPIFCRILTSLTIVVSISGMLNGIPTTAMAIPVAGDYLFTEPPVTGTPHFTGTFTTDGTKLTAWHITTPEGTEFSSEDLLVAPTRILRNDVHLFSYAFSYLEIDWDANRAGYLSLGDPWDFIVDSITYQPTLLPEPSVSLLLLTGLVMLTGYGWRQQRQAGLRAR